MWFNNFFPTFCMTDLVGKKLAKFENDLEFQNTFINLLNLSTYTFEWSGLPETCNERFLELILCLDGRAIIANDSEYGMLSLKCMPDGQELNMYGEFGYMFGYGWNGFNRRYTAYMQGSDNTTAQAVLCRDNDMCYPYYNYLIMASKRLTSCTRSIDVATKKLKTPYFITCEESQVKSVQKVLDDIEGNNDSVIVNKTTMPDMFQVLPTSLDSTVLKTLWESYSNLDSQIKTLLGIESASNQDKKERLLVDEVNADNSISNINVNMRLKCRERFCEIVNKMFGSSISVKLRDEYITETKSDNERNGESGMNEEANDYED